MSHQSRKNSQFTIWIYYDKIDIYIPFAIAVFKGIRKDYDITKKAEAIDVSCITYAMYEQANPKSDLVTINKMASFHKETTDYLLGRLYDSTFVTNDDKEFEAFANGLSLQKWD